MVVAEPSEVKNEDVQRWFDDMERVISDVTDASATSMEETTSKVQQFQKSGQMLS